MTMSIEDVAISLPALTQTAAEVSAMTGASVDFIIAKVGVSQRHILGPSETGLSLSVEACAKLIERHDGLRDAVDLLVVVTQNPDRRIPHNAPQLAHRLGLRETTASFDLSLGCSGYVIGLQVVEGFLAVTGRDHALLVTCDPYSRIIAAEDRDTNCVFGDAATATWIASKGSRSCILASDHSSHGDGADAIAIEAGGASAPFVSLSRPQGAASYERSQLRLTMKGRDVFNFVLSNVPSSIERCLKSANLTIEDIDIFALHQGSAYMLRCLAKQAHIPEEKLYINMHKYANTVSSSIPLVLHDLEAEGRLDGSLLLLSGFGVGLSIATAIVEFIPSTPPLKGLQ